jgi:hypothetical protein
MALGMQLRFPVVILPSVGSNPEVVNENKSTPPSSASAI